MALEKRTSKLVERVGGRALDPCEGIQGLGNTEWCQSFEEKLRAD